MANLLFNSNRNESIYPFVQWMTRKNSYPNTYIARISIKAADTLIGTSNFNKVLESNSFMIAGKIQTNIHLLLLQAKCPCHHQE